MKFAHGNLGFGICSWDLRFGISGSFGISVYSRLSFSPSNNNRVDFRGCNMCFVRLRLILKSTSYPVLLRRAKHIQKKNINTPAAAL